MMIIKIKTSDYHNQIIQVILDLGDYGFWKYNLTPNPLF